MTERAARGTCTTARPETNSAAYRGYPVRELCRRHSFEEVAYLFWHGELPSRDQISAQNRAERTQRAIAPAIAAAINEQPFGAHPVDTLQTAVSVLSANDPHRNDTAPAAIRARTLRLFAVLPSVIAMDQRRRHGLGAIAPRDHLGYAANFLYMTFGKVPEPQVVAAFETSLVLYAGHGLDTCPSTAAAGLYRAVADAMGTLKDLVPADASRTIMGMLNEIAIPDNAQPWLEEALADGRKITGFADHGPTDGDSRVPAMRAALGMIAALRGGHSVLPEVCDALASAMHDTTGLQPSLDYPASPAYQLIGFDTSAFTQILAAACLPGWTAHIAEQVDADSFDPSSRRP